MFRIGVLAATLLTATAAQAVPCQLNQVASLDIAIGAAGEALVPVTIKGQPEYFMLQLEVAHSAVTAKTATALALAEEPVPGRVHITYMQQDVRSLATATALKMGSAAGDVEVFVVPQLDSFDPRAAGVLGMDLLKNFDVELDIGAKKLNLFAPNQCEGHVVYWTHEPYAAVALDIAKMGNFTVPMELDGKKVRVSVATSFPQSTMSMAAAHSLFGFTEKSPGMTPASMPAPAGVDIWRRYAFKSLSGDDIAVTNPDIYVMGNYDPAMERCAGEHHVSNTQINRVYNCYGAEADVQLGLDIERRLHFYFDFANKVLYFTAADRLTNSPPAPSPPDTTTRK